MTETPFLLRLPYLRMRWNTNFFWYSTASVETARLFPARGIESQSGMLNASCRFNLAEHWTVTEINKSLIKIESTLKINSQAGRNEIFFYKLHWKFSVSFVSEHVRLIKYLRRSWGTAADWSQLVGQWIVNVISVMFCITVNVIFNFNITLLKMLHPFFFNHSALVKSPGQKYNNCLRRHLRPSA